MTYRILLTGSRTWRNQDAVWQALNDAVEQAQQAGHTEFVVVHGANPKGADAHASAFCEHEAGQYDNAGLVLVEERHPADWAAPCTGLCRTAHRRNHPTRGNYCPMAGLVRNQHMVALGADICLAFVREHSRGATDCVRRAERAGIDVRRWIA